MSECFTGVRQYIDVSVKCTFPREIRAALPGEGGVDRLSLWQPACLPSVGWLWATSVWPSATAAPSLSASLWHHRGAAQLAAWLLVDNGARR